MRADIVPGATFPDYELPDHENVPRRLSDLQGDDPMILTLARGHYCGSSSRTSTSRSTQTPTTTR